jgi:hypothetical protein
MASLRMTLLDLLNKSEQGADPNFLRDGVRRLAQELMEAEVTELVGAEPHQRTAGRTTYRNGYRDREWDTRVGTIELDIPKLRAGSYFPELARASAPARARAAFSRPGGLHPRRVDAGGRQPGRGAGHQEHLQGPGQPDLQRARRQGPRLPHPAPGWRVPIPTPSATAAASDVRGGSGHQEPPWVGEICKKHFPFGELGVHELGIVDHLGRERPGLNSCR